MTPLDRLRRYAREDHERLDLPRFEEIAARTERPSARRSAVIPFESIAAVAAIVVIVGALIASVRGSVVPAEVSSPRAPATSATASANTSGNVSANTAALRGLGRLAFSTSAGLFILDGGGTLTRLGDPGPAKWSYNGYRLAYLQKTSAGQELWFVRADGSDRQRVMGVPASSSLAFEWSPTESVLAVAPQDGAGVGGLWLVRPGGGPTLLAARDLALGSFAWSPTGDRIAYAVTLPASDIASRSDGLFTVDVHSGTVHQRLVTERAGIRGLAWWPDGKGLLYYRDPDHSASLLMDGVPLQSVLVDGSAGPLTFTASRRIETFDAWIDARRFVAILGKDRFATADRHLAICDVESASCQTVAPSDGTVDSEPALAFDRTNIAFVRAAERATAGFASDADWRNWVATRTLWVFDVGSVTAAEQRRAGSGVFAPSWSRDGKWIMLVRDQKAWLYEAETGEAHDLVGPLDPTTPFGGSGWRPDWWR